MNHTVKLTDQFWRNYQKLVRKEMIPYQWAVLSDAIDINIERERNDDTIPNAKSHAVENFRIAAGQAEGEHYGWVFQDSDVYKWLEAVAYSLNNEPDPELQSLADDVVELIAAAQEPDGYLDTYFTIKAPERRYKRLRESHELYCAGHFMEAAVAYHQATGNETVLQTAVKLADCIDRSFGPEDGKIHGSDGHEEVEIGLVRLYEETGEPRYLKLAEYFIEIRGKDPEFFAKQVAAEGDKEPVIAGMDSLPPSYYQADVPPVERTTADGHAVRVVYLCTGMAAIAARTGNEAMLAACRRLWRNIVDKRMYITGGIGSTYRGEAFTLDYDLPNDTMYCETCASIGLVFFARQMLLCDSCGEYADVMERALYNTVLAGMALDGKHFFYVNPLETDPQKSQKDPNKSHVKCVRPQWLGCACCPPNLARLLTSVEEYIYTVKEDTVLVNLFMESSVTIGSRTIAQSTAYPKNGKIALQISGSEEETVKRIGVRIPGWTESYAVSVNGNRCENKPEDGYLYFALDEQEKEIVLELPMEIQRWRANPLVSEDLGKTAVTRGPVVYCLEAADNGSHLHLLAQDPESELEYTESPILGGIGVITGTGTRKILPRQKAPLYQRGLGYETQTQKLTYIPYYAWANRGESEMSVWIREEKA